MGKDLGRHNGRSQEEEEQGCPCLGQKCLDRGYSTEQTGLDLEGRSYSVGFRQRRETGRFSLKDLFNLEGH